MSKYRNLVITAALATVIGAGPALAGKFGLGRTALPDEIAAWDKDVSPDGTGLPVGSGDVLTGEEIFAEYCAICHGDFAEGVDNWPKLAGGADTLDHEDPLKTVGSYWPHLTTAWDYVNRSMPFGNAQTLTTDEVYAIVAYILYSNDLVDEEFVLSNENLLDVELPNKDGFIIDDRAATEYPKFTVENACYENCKDSVEITMRAAVLDVTPEETRARKVQELIRRTKPRAQEVTQEVAAAAPAAETEAEAEPVVETAAAEPAAEATPAAAVDPALAAAGEKVFKKCKACHQVGDSAKNKTGPVLNGIMGSAFASVDGFKYSKAIKAMADDGMVWDEANMTEFLKKPRAFIKKTKMSFAGLRKDKDIEAVIAYLRTHAE